MAQQTAVDYLVNELRLNLTIYKHTKNVIEQAKAMEKEEHRQTYNQGLMSNFQNFDDYYNETYNNPISSQK